MNAPPATTRAAPWAVGVVALAAVVGGLWVATGSSSRMRLPAPDSCPAIVDPPFCDTAFRRPEAHLQPGPPSEHREGWLLPADTPIRAITRGWQIHVTSNPPRRCPLRPDNDVAPPPTYAISVLSDTEDGAVLVRYGHLRRPAEPVPLLTTPGDIIGYPAFDPCTGERYADISASYITDDVVHDVPLVDRRPDLPPTATAASPCSAGVVHPDLAWLFPDGPAVDWREAAACAPPATPPRTRLPYNTPISRTIYEAAGVRPVGG